MAGDNVDDGFDVGGARALKTKTKFFVDDVDHRLRRHRFGDVKSIYSLIDLREISLGCNHRYLAFLSSRDDPSAGQRDLHRLSQQRVGADPSAEGGSFRAAEACRSTGLRTSRSGLIHLGG